MIAGRFAGILAEDSDHGGTSRLDIADGRFTLELTRCAPYSISDTDIFSGAVEEVADGMTLRCSEHRLIHDEDGRHEEVRPCTRWFVARALADGQITVDLDAAHLKACKPNGRPCAAPERGTIQLARPQPRRSRRSHESPHGPSSQ